MTARDSLATTVALGIFFAVMAGFAVPDWSLVSDVAAATAKVTLVQVVVAIALVTIAWSAIERWLR